MWRWDKMNLTILYEDNHLIVCVKPPGVLSQPGSKNLPDMLTLLKAYLKEKYVKPGNVFLGLVHRLDLNVGGVMVFARTSKAASRLSDSIREHAFQKTYIAIVEGGGFANNEQGTYLDQLEKEPNDRIAEIDSSGKQAELHYRALASGSWKKIPVTFMEIQLVTGRFHQIRVQFASRGHPLLNDRKYGAKSLSKSNEIGLWAYRLSFPHPVTQETLVFFAPPEGELFGPFQSHFSALLPL